jgi:hypothetical protein
VTIGGNDSGPHPDHSAPRDHLRWFLARAHAQAGTTSAFRNFFRTRAPGGHCTMSVLGQDTTLTAASNPTSGPADPATEYACWGQLRSAIRTANDGDIATAATLLPLELTAAEWVQDGHTIRIRRSGTTTRALRCARRKLGAFTPLPLLATLTQPLAGGATAAGILLAPIPLPSPHEPPPISMPALGRPLTGDVYRPAPATIPGAHPLTPAIGPGAPLFPRASTPVAVQPADAAGRDTAPTAPAPQPYTPPPAGQRTTPTVNPAPSTAPTVSPSPKPSPTTTGILDETSPSPSPTVTGTPTPPVAPSPITTRKLRHHHWPHRHPLRHLR